MGRVSSHELLQSKADTSHNAAELPFLVVSFIVGRLVRSMRMNPQRWLIAAALIFFGPAFLVGPWQAGYGAQPGHVRGSWFIAAPLMLAVVVWLLAPVLNKVAPAPVKRVLQPVLALRTRLRTRKGLLKMKEQLVRVMKLNVYRNERHAGRMVKLTPLATDGIVRADFVVPSNYDDSHLMGEMPVYASALKLIRITPMDEDPRAGFVTVLLCAVDPLLAHLDGSKAPVLHLTEEERCDPNFWLPIGIDSNGQFMERPMFMRELGSVRALTSGGSGTGKSSIVRQQLLQATLNPNIDVVITDGKGSEFGIFAPYVESYETSVAGFWTQIRLLEDEVVRRGTILREQRENLWTLEQGNFLRWVWDELGVVLAGMDAKLSKEAQQRIYGIASVARSLGISIEFSSQTFKSDLLATPTRDNCFDMKTGFKADKAQESAYLGFSSDDDVRPDLIRGTLLKSGRSSSVGQFATYGLGKPTYGKSFYISNEQIQAALNQLQPLANVDKGEAEVDF